MRALDVLVVAGFPRNHHSLKPWEDPGWMPGRGSFLDSTGVVMRRSLREKLIASGVLALAAVAVAVATSIPLRAAGPTAVGLWEQVDENSGKAESWIKISERNGVYEGNIVKIFFKPGQDENWVCSKCEGSEKGAPVLGLTLIKGMLRNGLSYENGTVRDPRDGSVYRASMKISTDGKKLEMRGYLGISLFGRSQVWNRLPDNALGPPVASASPASKAGAQKKQ